MKQIALTFLLFTIVAAPAFAQSETEYQKEWCVKHKGEIDYQTQEKTRSIA
jgi:hypothetical protein